MELVLARYTIYRFAVHGKTDLSDVIVARLMVTQAHRGCSQQISKLARRVKIS